MSFLPGNQTTRLTGTTPIVVVEAPGAGVIRLVKEIIVINDDTSDATIRAQLTGTDLGTVDFLTEKVTKDTSKNLMAAQTAVIVLDTTGQAIKLYLSSLPAASNPVCTVQYADFTPVDVTPFIVRWDTYVDFNKGTLVDTTIIGFGNEAYIQVSPYPDNDDDITYTLQAQYTLSSGTDLEIAAGFARLKALTGTDMDWPFTVAGNYTIPAEIEVTGGVAQLKSQVPAAATFYANFSSSIDGTWGNGTLTGTATGGASVSGGKLDLTGATTKYVDYDADLNADSQQVGCIRFLLTPNYSGTPASGQIFVSIDLAHGDTSNLVQVQQQSGGGELRFGVFDQTGAIIIAYNAAVFNPTAGVEYEIELNWDITTGATRIFLDGVQQGVTQTATGTRSSAIGLFRLGNNAGGTAVSRFKLDDVLIFSNVQHTSNYTPGASIPQTKYVTTDPAIYPNTGFVFSSPLGSFTVDDTVVGGALKYQMSSDDGTTYKWWNGGAWVGRTTSSTQNVASAIATTVGVLTAGNLASIQTLDASTYDVQEVSGAPGFTVEMDWNNIIVQPSQITIHGYYAGNPAHTVNVDMWNYSLAQWDTMGTMPSAGSITQYNFAVTGTKADYFSGTAARVRVNHVTAGNITHDLYLDYVYILMDANPSDSWWYTNETNTEAEVATNISTLAASGTAKWIQFLHSNDGTGTPVTNNINIGESIVFSTTDDLYVDTKAGSQIAPTNIAAWLTALLTYTLPANTDLKMLVSTDGRVTWQKDVGAGWITEAGATLRANAMTIAQIVANIGTLGLGSGTFDLRLFIYTSDNTVRPTATNFNLTSDAGSPATGTWQSNEYDSTNIGQDWGEVNITQTTPGSSTIEIKARGGDVSGALGSYGAALTDGDDAGVTGRYIQFFGTFTPSGVDNPLLDRIQCAYVTPIITEVAP